MAGSKKNGGNKRVTRFTHDAVKEPRTPETGHTPLLPADEQIVTLPLDQGWIKGLKVGSLAEGEKPVIVDLDPAIDPVLLWAGKRSQRQVPVLPLQRNEIITEPRIAHVIERAQRAASQRDSSSEQGMLFAELEKSLREADKGKRVGFYTHDEGWRNKLVCGDSLHVMESLLHYEGLRGKVQMIYLDPPYGIKYDSNFQQRIDSIKNDDKDKADDVLTIKAFNDTWAWGIHSYLSHLHERLYLARELLSDKGSVFVQISDENVHLVRSLLDEVFGRDNFISIIPFRKKTMPLGTTLIEQMSDFLLWYGKEVFSPNGATNVRFNKLYLQQDVEGEFHHCWFELPDGTRHRMTSEQLANHSLLPEKARVYRLKSLEPSGPMESGMFDYKFEGKVYPHSKNGYGTTPEGMDRLKQLRRLQPEGSRLTFILYADESSLTRLTVPWNDTVGADDKQYVVQTNSRVVERCMLMTTNPGDLVLDPTCGSGTTALVAERWGRRWVTCDTSRVAINVARKRLLSSAFPHFKLIGSQPSSGLIYRRARRTTLGSLANAEEPQELILTNDPEVDTTSLRVTGPLEVLSIGRYSLEDWKGVVATEPLSRHNDTTRLKNYIEVICRLYRKDAALQGAAGLVHAVAESEKEKIAISIGPLSGRVTAKQINDAVQDSLASGILDVHVLGWAFEANVGEVKSQLESRGKVKIALIMIRPDTLAEGLTVPKPELLFSPLVLPDIQLDLKKNKELGEHVIVTLKGVGVFDRKRRTTDYHKGDSGYVSAWYLDEDYDGDCFVDCQMFFDFRKKPAIEKLLNVVIDPSEWKFQTTSEAFKVGSYRRVAVKVVDVFGNESTVVREI